MQDGNLGIKSKMAPNISELQSIYNYLQTSGIGASAYNSDDNYLNTIWSSYQDIQNITDANEQQKSKGIQNLIDKVLSLIKKATGSNNESKEASAEVKSNSADSRDLTTEASQTEEEMIAQIEDIKIKLQGHIDVITIATSNIGDKTKALQTQLDALKSIQAQIQQKQEALAQLDRSSSTYQKDATQLLNDIKNLAKLIPAITSSLTGIQESFNVESQNVANAYTAVELLKGNAVEVQQNGQNQILNISAKAMQEVQDNVQSQQTSIIENKPTAQVAQQAGETASSNVFTAAEAPKLFKVSIDHTLASTTRFTGSTNNLQTLQQGIGRLNSSNQALTGFSGDIEAQLSTFNTAIGEWNKKIEPMIRSIGSMDLEAINTASQGLISVVDSDLTTIENPSNNNVLQTSNYDISGLNFKLEQKEEEK